MRDITGKHNTLRSATAQATLRLGPAALEAIKAGRVPKGDPLPVARVAAVQAAKNTAQIIPYCHPLPVEHVSVDYVVSDQAIDIRVQVKAIYKTGVEMEALTAAAVAALTIYDMTKMLDSQMEITGVRLLDKHGGKSDAARALDGACRAAVLVISDSVACGRGEDGSGVLIDQALRAAGADVAAVDVRPDDPQAIEDWLIRGADELKLDVLLTTGGTGLGPRDHTPEVMQRVVDRDLGSITEALRAHGQVRTPMAMLSRARAGTRGNTLIVNLPGAPAAVAESLPLLITVLPHALRMMAGDRHQT